MWVLNNLVTAWLHSFLQLFIQYSIVKSISRCHSRSGIGKHLHKKRCLLLLLSKAAFLADPCAALGRRVPVGYLQLPCKNIRMICVRVRVYTHVQAYTKNFKLVIIILKILPVVKTLIDSIESSFDIKEDFTSRFVFSIQQFQVAIVILM